MGLGQQGVWVLRLVPEGYQRRSCHEYSLKWTSQTTGSPGLMSGPTLSGYIVAELLTKWSFSSPLTQTLQKAEGDGGRYISGVFLLGHPSLGKGPVLRQS